MKVFMLIVNVIIMILSFLAIIVNLIGGNFGIAWLYVIPLIYELFNCMALCIDE